MQIKLLEILACPKCYSDVTCEATETEENGNIVSGSIKCLNCKQEYPIIKSIPRFVENDNYASSFGYQWNRFRREQIDSFNGTKISAKRFYSETGWNKEGLKGKWILDVGCGAGRFLDVVAETGAEAVGIDISNAIEVSRMNLDGKSNVHFIQASIYDLPFKKNVFDGVYCIGVIQHTPFPKKSLEVLPGFLKENGEVVVTVYEKKWYTPFYGKYLWRPFLKNLSDERLLSLINRTMPFLFPLTSFLFSLPLIGKLFIFLIPIANYVHEKELSREQRYAWAVLDTFDMLSPEFDQPPTPQEIWNTLSAAGVRNMRRLPNAGVNIVGEK
jgi:ubiquinone/menaquinone biosynthesis C-methylase UbiE/uncharacterized protein YbaR (Trm112 family)